MPDELKLDNCVVCNGGGCWQINEPLQVGICMRCHGTGKDRVVQIIDSPMCDSSIIALTANGLSFIHYYKLGWKKFPN
jgi:hypothetical protein